MAFCYGRAKVGHPLLNSVSRLGEFLSGDVEDDPILDKAPGLGIGQDGICSTSKLCDCPGARSLSQVEHEAVVAGPKVRRRCITHGQQSPLRSIRRV